MKLTFIRSELLYDVGNYAYVHGDLMENDHQAHQLVDITEDGNVDRVSRIISLGIQECRQMLYPYTKKEESREEVNDKLNAPDVYEIDMNLPKDFAEGTVDLLEELIHEYLICRVLDDWLGISAPNVKNPWADKMKTIRSKIKSSLPSRIGKTRRPLCPF